MLEICADKIVRACVVDQRIAVAIVSEGDADKIVRAVVVAQNNAARYDEKNADKIVRAGVVDQSAVRSVVQIGSVIA